MIDRFTQAATANRARVHGPLAAPEARAHMVRMVLDHAGGADIALPLDDATLDSLGLEERLAAAGGRLLRPDDPAWRERLPGAAVGVTGAVVAVATTGTTALAATSGTPRATSLVPPVHVCVVRTRDVVEDMTTAMDRLAGAPLPSALTWVGGPSRTSDLEMRPTFGVHGPKAVELLLLEAD